MVEEIYVLLKIDDENKKIFVDRKIFALGSEEAKKAKLEEKEIYTICISKNYDVYCNDSLVSKFSQVKQSVYEEQKRQAADEYYRKMKEIRAKDIVDLTEEEIVLLAKFRVHGIRSFSTPFGKVLQKETTFEQEYKKLTDLIAERRNTPKR